MTEEATFEAWAIVEIMGHVRLAGKVSEQKIAGTMMLRIDVPRGDNETLTLFYGAASIFSIAPTTEEIARSVAKRNQPEPVHRYELPQLAVVQQRTYPGELPPEAYQEHDTEFEYDDSDDDDGIEDMHKFPAEVF